MPGSEPLALRANFDPEPPFTSHVCRRSHRVDKCQALLAATSAIVPTVTRGAVCHRAKKTPCISLFSRKARRGGNSWERPIPIPRRLRTLPSHEPPHSLPIQDTDSRSIATSIESAVGDNALVRSALAWLGLGRVDLIVRVDRVLVGRRQLFTLQCRWVRRGRIRAAHCRRRKRVQRWSSVVIHRDGDISDRHQPKRDGQSPAPSCKPAVTEVPRCLVHCHDHLQLTCC